MRILWVADDAELTRTCVPHLKRHGHEVMAAREGRSAPQDALGADLVLLDLDLLDYESLRICEAIRKRADTPVISFTASTAELDRVLALRAGSDDCLVKPLGMAEMLARIDAVTRRHRTVGLPFPDDETITRGPLCIDPLRRNVRLHGRPVPMTRKEFDLLHLLACDPTVVLTRDVLLRKVWGDAVTGGGRTLDTHISSIRGKLGSRSWIVAVRGVGFRMGRV